MSLYESVGKDWDRRKAVHLDGPNHAADFIVDRMREAVSGPSPSRPGNPPGLVSGTLRSSIHAVHGSGQASVECDAPYGSILENGSERMAARPFFRDTIEECQSEVERMIFGSD